MTAGLIGFSRLHVGIFVTILSPGRMTKFPDICFTGVAVTGLSPNPRGKMKKSDAPLVRQCKYLIV